MGKRDTDPMRNDRPIVHTRWSKEEVSALLTAMNVNRDALKFKFDGPGGGKDVKRQGWRDVAKYLNDVADTHRTVQQCRNKADDYTQRSKAKYNKLRHAVSQTGRGKIKNCLKLKKDEDKALDYLREEAVRGIPGIETMDIEEVYKTKPSKKNKALLWDPQRESKPDYRKVKMDWLGVPRNYRDKNKRRIERERKLKDKKIHEKLMKAESKKEHKEAKKARILLKQELREKRKEKARFQKEKEGAKKEKRVRKKK